MLEINEEIKDLRNLGLTEEEIEGYIDFFLENWMTPLTKTSKLVVSDDQN